MTTQSARVTQTHATMDLFAAFADQILAGENEPVSGMEAESVARLALWALTEINNPACTTSTMSISSGGDG